MVVHQAKVWDFVAFDLLSFDSYKITVEKTRFNKYFNFSDSKAYK